MNCQHCTDIQAEMAVIRATVERLDHELLGNGQPGRLKQQDDKISRLEDWKAKAHGAIAVLLMLWTATLALAAVLLPAKLKP
jgi:hypothetical protein